MNQSQRLWIFDIKQTRPLCLTGMCCLRKQNAERHKLAACHRRKKHC